MRKVSEMGDDSIFALGEAWGRGHGKKQSAG